MSIFITADTNNFFPYSLDDVIARLAKIPKPTLLNKEN